MRGERRENEKEMKKKKKKEILTITTPMQSFRTSHKPRPNKQTRQSKQRPRNPTYHRRPISNRGTTKSLGDSLDHCKPFSMSVNQSSRIHRLHQKQERFDKKRTQLIRNRTIRKRARRNGSREIGIRTHARRIVEWTIIIGEFLDET